MTETRPAMQDLRRAPDERLAALTILPPAVRGQGAAFARAGLRAQLQLTPDVFDA